MSTAIKTVKARKIINESAEYTIEVDVITDGGGSGRFSAPFAALGSKGLWEPPAYPVGGVDEAVRKVNNEVGFKLAGLDSADQNFIDKTLQQIDQTPNFSNIGVNTATAVSIAVAKAAASTLGLPLYKYLCSSSELKLSIPIANTIGGGPHAKKGKSPDMQEHHVIPLGAKSVREAINVLLEVYKRALKSCDERDPEFGGRTDFEGALVPNFTDEESLELLTQICQQIEKERGITLCLGVDIAASYLWDEKEQVYVYECEKKKRTPEEQIEHVSDLIESYPLYYVEDPFHCKDYESFMELTKKYGGDHLICGDDVFACSFNRLTKGIEMAAANCLVIKVNMTGTLTNTHKIVKLAKDNRYVPVQSRRSIETDDSAVAHLAIAWGCPFNKFGVKGAAAAKLNELLRIEEEVQLLDTANA